MRPIEILPQRCWECRRELGPGDLALAAAAMPVAFCDACGTAIREKRPGAELVRAVVVKDEGEDGAKGPERRRA